MLSPRALGRTALQLSPLSFGSMRLHERTLSDGDWEQLLRESVALGVTALHSSTEYESFPRFCSIVRRLSDLAPKLQHIVKVGEPHFDVRVFDFARLEAKIDDYLNALGTERIEVVQWMWRGDLAAEQERLSAFQTQKAEVEEAFARLRRSGKIACVAPFPYSVGFADLVLDADGFEGLTIYLNRVEREMAAYAERAASAGKGIIAIRPLAAGKALAQGFPPSECITAVLAEPAVTTAVVGYSSVTHLREMARSLLD